MTWASSDGADYIGGDPSWAPGCASETSLLGLDTPMFNTPHTPGTPSRCFSRPFAEPDFTSENFNGASVIPCDYPNDSSTGGSFYQADQVSYENPHQAFLAKQTWSSRRPAPFFEQESEYMQFSPSESAMNGDFSSPTIVGPLSAHSHMASGSEFDGEAYYDQSDASSPAWSSDSSVGSPSPEQHFFQQDENSWLNEIPQFSGWASGPFETLDEQMEASIPKAALGLDRKRFNAWKKANGIVFKQRSDEQAALTRVRRAELARGYARLARQRRREAKHGGC